VLLGDGQVRIAAAMFPRIGLSYQLRHVAPVEQLVAVGSGPLVLEDPSPPSSGGAVDPELNARAA